MDSLEELPTVESHPTPQENAVIQEFFASPAQQNQQTVQQPPVGQQVGSQPQQSMKQLSTATTGNSKRKLDFKKLGATMLLFAMLANPWIDGLVCKIPKCENPQTVFVVKLVVFLLGVILIQLCL